MPTTHRRKIARSVAIRRVKPNAKRKERKTQKRKSRNKVMKGGVHEKLKVYVIQQNLGTPKCIIVRQTKPLSKDTIYLFFESKLDLAEITEFVCAAMGVVDSTAPIEPALTIIKNRSEPLNDLFIKLSGIRNYSIESGLLSKSLKISEGPFTTHTIPNAKMEKLDVIEQLKEKSKTKQDYTFTEFTERFYFRDENFNLGDLTGLFDSVMRETAPKIRTHCLTQPISQQIEELKKMVERQLSVYLDINACARSFVVSLHTPGSAVISKEQEVENTIAKFNKTEYDFSGADKLMDDIKRDTLYEKCKVLIDPTCLKYIDGTNKFKSVEELVNKAYEITVPVLGK